MQLITNSVSKKGVALVAKVINKMSGFGKPRKKFMVHIMSLYMCMRGRYVFKGMACYGDMCGKSYRLHFAKAFDFLGFNLSLCDETGGKRFISAFDPSFLPQSGKKTEGLGKFWGGCLGKAAPGLEAGAIAAIDLDGGGAYGLEAVLTPPPAELRAADKSLVDHYASVLSDRAEKLKKVSSDVKTASMNEKMMLFFFSTFQVDPELQKNQRLTDLFLRYGTIAA